MQYYVVICVLYRNDYEGAWLQTGMKEVTGDMMDR